MRVEHRRRDNRNNIQREFRDDLRLHRFERKTSSDGRSRIERRGSHRDIPRQRLLDLRQTRILVIGWKTARTNERIDVSRHGIQIQRREKFLARNFPFCLPLGRSGKSMLRSMDRRIGFRIRMIDSLMMRSRSSQSTKSIAPNSFWESLATVCDTDR